MLKNIALSSLILIGTRAKAYKVSSLHTWFLTHIAARKEPQDIDLSQKSGNLNHSYWTKNIVESGQAEKVRKESAL